MRPSPALAALLLAASATNVQAAAETLLLDIRSASHSQVEAYKKAEGVDWWIELGDELLLAGDGETLRAQSPAHRRARALGPLRAEDLVLHARGCGDGPAPEDLRITALDGSYELLRRPADPARQQALASRHPEHLGAAEWIALQPNSVILRQHRLDREAVRAVRAVDPVIEAIVARVDGQRWFDTVSQLASWDRSSYNSSTDTSSGLYLSRQWIRTQFEALGLQVSEPTFSMTLGGNPAERHNVAGRLTGWKYPDQWLLVGAHYDSRQQTSNIATQTPGADDNASGCAGVIETARALVPARPEKTLIFLCYAGEEQGLWGSTGHASELAASGDLAKVQAMANMDMIGWDNGAGGFGVTITTAQGTNPGGDLAANIALRDRFGDAAANYVPALSVVKASNACCSDQQPYLNRGVRAVHSIHRGGVSYPHYHKTTDTPANMNSTGNSPTLGGHIVRMNVAALAELAGVTDRIFATPFD
ncbi:MAG: Zn-dependent exopeptidase M28 [Rhodanobacteraceae bacterium]|nr:Zn-dependent exopeptidase M28 [Rhodanobacteraceae bacterium]